MNADAALEWLDIEGFNQWRLFRGDEDGQKVSEFEASESQEEALARLRRILPIQSSGKYTLKGWKGKNRQAAQSIFTFEIKAMPVQQHSSGSRNYDLDEIRKEAERAAYIKYEGEQWRISVDKRLDALEKSIEDLKKSILELHDDDEENDGDAFERLTSVATKLPQLEQGMQSLKGMLKIQ